MMYSTKKILNKLTESCTSATSDTAVLMMTFKLYLTALSGYCKYSKVINNEVTDGVTNVQVCLRSWLPKHDTGMGDHFGGNNGKKIKEEIKVCQISVYNVRRYPIPVIKHNLIHVCDGVVVTFPIRSHLLKMYICILYKQIVPVPQ